MQWNSEEIELLNSFKKSKFRDQWKKISNQFSRRGFQKTQLQCKRKWMELYNQHLDSSEWTFSELQTLYTLYNMHNSQWSLIHKSIPSKNKVKIRNRFYGTLRNFIRFLLQHFEQAPGTITIVSNKIKPIILQKLYSSEQQFQFVGETIRNLISTMNYSVDKQKLANEVNKDQQFYLKILNMILKKKSKLRVKQKLLAMKENFQIRVSSKIYKNSSEEQNNQKSPSNFFHSADVQAKFSQNIVPVLAQDPSINFPSNFLPRLLCSPQIIVWPSQQQLSWKYPIYFQI